jgi:hypothetical protein
MARSYAMPREAASINTAWSALACKPTIVL